MQRKNKNAYIDSIGGLFESQGKLTKIKPITEKPCNHDYDILSSEAKKNLSERYFYDQNTNQW